MVDRGGTLTHELNPMDAGYIKNMSVSSSFVGQVEQLAARYGQGQHTAMSAFVS